MQYVEIYNAGELPKLGSGYRRVFANEGRKHVRIFYPAEASFHKMPKQKFLALKPKVCEPKKSHLLKHITWIIETTGQEATKQLREMKRQIKQF